MTTFAYPSVTPNSTVIDYVGNTAFYRSPSNAIQTVRRGGEFLRISLTHRNLKGDDRATMLAFVAKLRGQVHRFSVQNHAANNRGNFGGTPLVMGAGQLGTDIDIDGCSLSVTDWIREGDWFGIGNELKMCTADANSDGSGEATISFSPPLRKAPADNAVITTVNATGIFMLEPDAAQWSNRPGIFSDITLVGIEDVMA